MILRRLAPIEIGFPYRSPDEDRDSAMILRIIGTLLLVGIILFSFGCKEKRETEELEIDFGYEYFPLEVGKFIEYTIDSVVYDTTGIGVVIDSSTTFLREEVTETFMDLSNQLNYRIERFERKSANEDWALKSVYSSYRDESSAFRIEDNFRFIKMVYPLDDGDIWDGNLFIDKETIVTVAGESIEVYKDWSYELDGLDESFAINNMLFDSVATIFQANNQVGLDVNNIELRFSFEKYAKGVGLIYREMRILDTQCIAECIGQTWEEKAQKGFILIQTITDHN